jgi:hypothetical protein
VRSDTARSSSSSSPLACHGIDLPLCCLVMEEEDDDEDEDEGPARRVTDRVLARIHVSARVRFAGPVEGRMSTCHHRRC